MKKKIEPKTMQDAFIDEVNEDLKNDNLKRLWDHYGLYIIIFTATAILAAVSFESIKAWRISQHQQKSDAYAYTMSLKEQGKIDESSSAFKNMAENESGIYADAAKMQLAKNYSDAGKTKEAENVLNEIIENGDTNEKVKNVALIKLASLKAEYAPFADVEKLVSPLLENPSWRALAKNILAVSAIKNADLEKAKTLYEEISMDGNAPESLKTEAIDMISVINEK